jgi:hypothetical protein
LSLLCNNTNDLIPPTSRHSSAGASSQLLRLSEISGISLTNRCHMAMIVNSLKTIKAVKKRSTHPYADRESGKVAESRFRM